MLWRAREWVGDWPGSDERRDRGGDFRSDWLQHVKEDTHALAKGHVQHLPTAMGYLEGDDVRQHACIRDIGPRPMAIPGGNIPRTRCQGANLPTKEAVRNTCGSGALLLSFLADRILEEKVKLNFYDVNAGVRRDVRVNMDQVETLT